MNLSAYEPPSQIHRRTWSRDYMDGVRKTVRYTHEVNTLAGRHRLVVSHDRGHDESPWVLFNEPAEILPVAVVLVGEDFRVYGDKG